ncbi:MAG TPA: hypothetical protein DEQ61_15410, partial [Streptomyces sp.]|nr:hypothetical protein [Streptomyces sp.]
PHTPPHQAQQQPPQQPQGRAARRSAERKRSLSPMALAGIVLVGCVVAGLAAGAGLSGGDGSSGDDKEPIAASDSPSPAEDPVETQAKALDKLLAASNDSRSSVIKAVKNIGICTNLPQAAEDLREAAEQRNGLVTELGELSVDRLPDHKALTASLTSAWKASAAADSHYAGWADQVARKKGCPGGKAKATGRTAMGNQASGEATAAKKKAARLWNPIARDHGLPERQYLDL